MVTGVIQAGSSLGILVPPSVVLVLYAMIARQPVGQLWLAGIVPGLMMATLFVIYIALRCRMRPELGPPLPPEERYSLDVPVLFNQYGLTDIWGEEYAKVGIKHISAGAWDPCHFATKEPIRSLADLQGKRVFTFPTAGRFLAQFGVVPVTLPWEDIEVAVQTGELDGVAWSGITEDYTVGWADVTNYFLENNISGAWIGHFFANTDRWNELPPNLQESLRVTFEFQPLLPAMVVLGRRSGTARQWREDGAYLDPRRRVGSGRRGRPRLLGRDRRRVRGQGPRRADPEGLQRDDAEGRATLPLQRRLRLVPAPASLRAGTRPSSPPCRHARHPVAPRLPTPREVRANARPDATATPGKPTLQEPPATLFLPSLTGRGAALRRLVTRTDGPASSWAGAGHGSRP